MESIQYTPIDQSDSDLDIMTRESWIESVNNDIFKDDDGYGCLATALLKSNWIVYPSYVFDDKIVYIRPGFHEKIFIDEKDIKYFTHIIWYNK